jgi:hypothetical protein
MISCCVVWGALGVLSFDDPDALSTAAHRYVCMLLATSTTCSVMVNLFARLVRAIRLADPAAPSDGRYADGYADGLDARPEASVSRLAPARR